eukprot:537944-Pelagomonas_calceolata.AAC.1
MAKLGPSAMPSAGKNYRNHPEQTQRGGYPRPDTEATMKVPNMGAYILLQAVTRVYKGRNVV